MGNEIVYCGTCQTRLLASEFDDGKAFRVAGRPYCVRCTMGLLTTLAPEEGQRILTKIGQKRGLSPPSESTPRRGTGARSNPTTRVPVLKTERRTVPASASPPSRGALLAFGVAASAAGVVVLVAAVLSGRRNVPEKTPPPVVRPDPPAAPPPPERADPPPKPAVRAEDSARKALEKAREHGRAKPADWTGRIAVFEEAVWECRGTTLFAEARREHELLQKQRGDLIAAELGPEAEKARAASGREQYAAAIELLRQARSRLAGGDWTAAIDQKILEIRHEAQEAYAAVREKALDARRRGAEEEVKAASSRVASWGLDDLASELRTSLAATPPPAPSLPPEVRAYAAAWENALTLARAREYGSAVRELEAAPAVDRAEAAVDLELLKLVAAAHADILQALARWPKGQPLSLEVEDEAGTPMRVEGTVVRASPTWVELRKEPDLSSASFEDLTAEGLRELLKKIPGRRPEADARAAALFVLLEGDVGAAAGLPAKYRAFGARVAQERSNDALVRKEADARSLFQAAENDYRDPAATLDSFDRYRALLASHGQTAFVRRKRSALAARLESAKEAGQEYFFYADQMRASGTFGKSVHAKAPACWTSAADAAQEKGNAVEFAFAALPATDYRCWVYVGACCAETFTFSVEGTDMAAAPVKHTILFLKKTHAAHGGRKEPARFEWVAVPLPRYAAGGPKTVRLLSGQQGFTVAYAMVSARRASPPGESAVRDGERVRPPVPAAALSTRDPSLAAWWTLDDGRGTAAGDASPAALAGTLRNAPVWTSGRRRGALSFDGRDDYVEIAKNPRLYFAGPFSVSAWINVAELPTSEFGMYVVSDYSADGTLCTFSLRILPSGNAQFFWQGDGVTPSRGHATSAAPVAPATWVHLAGVWDGSVRSLYLNGGASGTNDVPLVRGDVGGSVSIGRPGSFNGLYFRGRIDDVRLYSRALSAAEVRSLSRGN